MLVVVAFPFRKVRPAFWGHVLSPGGAPTHRDTAKSGSSGELPLHVKVSHGVMNMKKVNLSNTESGKVIIKSTIKIIKCC